MPPKVTVTPDEDVKFLLTIIKLAGVGTVLIPALRFSRKMQDD